jgi:hypothetical protein
VSKIGEELRQTAPDAPNVVVLSFFDTFPSDFARKWAVADLLSGGGPFTVGSDLSNLARVDSIFEFSRTRLLNTHVNPNTDADCRNRSCQLLRRASIVYSEQTLLQADRLADVPVARRSLLRRVAPRHSERPRRACWARWLQAGNRRCR